MTETPIVNFLAALLEAGFPDEFFWKLYGAMLLELFLSLLLIVGIPISLLAMYLRSNDAR
jgi:hypothetical protein